MTRTLVFGGTFNPVHLGHLRLIDEARRALEFDRVDWIPCHAPFHKDADGLLPFAFRLALVEAAVSGDSTATVNAIESRLPAPSFTFQTLEALAAESPATERHFVLGEKEFLRLHAWKRGRDVAALAHLVVATQPGFDRDRFARAVAVAWPDSAAVPPPSGAVAAFELMPGRRAVVVDLPRLDISSSRVRDRWRADQPLDGLVPPRVLVLLNARRAQVDRAWSAEPQLKTLEPAHDL
ncbi:MAG: nicotinate (nicotinamide) nucleotide adenylyltransferase [Rhodobacterales bacterium]|nr:nicotinate (nicotinamide) nucleotide adenylyltransferase [Rhodobacterales bacterium]